MKIIRIYEHELMTRCGFNGFYRHFLSAWVEHAGARGPDEPRPLPRITPQRKHNDCWAVGGVVTWLHGGGGTFAWAGRDSAWGRGVVEMDAYLKEKQTEDRR